MKQIRVVLAERHPVMRAGLRYFLQKGTDIVVLAETDKGFEVLNLVALYAPDMIIIDILLQDMMSFEIIQRLQVSHPFTHILVMSTADESHALKILTSGVHGCLLKDEVPELLLTAVREIVDGQHRWFSHCVVSLLSQKRVTSATNLNAGLSQRETQILSMIAHGCDNQKIAEDLCLSLGTIKNYVTNIYLKIQVNTRAGAVAWAWQYRLVESDTEKEAPENAVSHHKSYDLQTLNHG